MNSQSHSKPPPKTKIRQYRYVNLRRFDWSIEQRSRSITYTQPGSSWRPSACEADVIATRPWVLCVMALKHQTRRADFLKPQRIGRAHLWCLDCSATIDARTMWTSFPATKSVRSLRRYGMNKNKKQNSVRHALICGGAAWEPQKSNANDSRTVYASCGWEALQGQRVVFQIT